MLCVRSHREPGPGQGDETGHEAPPLGDGVGAPERCEDPERGEGEGPRLRFKGGGPAGSHAEGVRQVPTRTPTLTPGRGTNLKKKPMQGIVACNEDTFMKQVLFPEEFFENIALF